MNVIDHKLFILSGYRTILMQGDDQGKLQTLLEKCADYSLLVAGFPPKPSAAVSLLADYPPGKTLADKFVIGFSTEQYRLFGVLDAVRDYPRQGDWWLGLLLLDPAQRNKGLGKRIVQSFEHWVSEQGARRIFLGFLEENQKACRFWRTMGFEIVGRQPVRQFGNLTHVVITMAHNIFEG